jgi:hypothetical protein
VNGSPFLAVADGGGGLASVQFCIVSFANGSLGIIRSINGGTLIAQTGPGVVAANAWYGMEIEVPVGSSVTGQIWVNGSQVLNVSGLNTQATSHAYGSQVWIGNLNNQLGAGVIMDDFRVWDNTGANMNAPVGLDTRLVTKLPSGAVTTSWTPNGSAANWQCEDDSPPDGDTTYTSNASTPSYETYSMISAGFTAAPVMVVARSMVRKDDGATRTMQNGAWRGSGGYSGYGSGTGSFTVGSTYQFFDCAVALDPGSGSAWTAATADAALFYKSETA